MPEGRCRNCNRLIYDTEKLEELKDIIECQHCSYLNVIREPKPEKPELKVYQCRICGAKFPKPIEVATHVRFAHRSRK